jgi:hypothetical protein
MQVLIPEQTIEIYGGPAVLNIRFMRIVMEANDKEKRLTYLEIIKEIAEEIGVEPIHVGNALQKFWSGKSKPTETTKQESSTLALALGRKKEETGGRLVKPDGSGDSRPSISSI